jgi:hypothetical protein
MLSDTGRPAGTDLSESTQSRVLNMHDGYVSLLREDVADISFTQ